MSVECDMRGAASRLPFLTRTNLYTLALCITRIISGINTATGLVQERNVVLSCFVTLHDYDSGIELKYCILVEIFHIFISTTKTCFCNDVYSRPRFFSLACAIVACRTDVIFLLFAGEREGEHKARGERGAPVTRDELGVTRAPRSPRALFQPRPQGVFGVQNGVLEKTLANNRSRVSKNIGDFHSFKLAVVFVIGLFKVT